MRILFVVDGRSPIALNWINYFLERGDEVHLVSTFECEPDERFSSVQFVPVAFSQFKKPENKREKQNETSGRLWGSSFVNLRTSVRRFLSPISIPGAAEQLNGIIASINPDIVHAMRIPFEGMLAARALRQDATIPLIISVWGNDFTLHAGATPWMKRYTRETMARTDGLHTDCFRDLHLASDWGLSKETESLVVPGNGGIRSDLFYPSDRRSKSDGNLVINPRGFRSYIRNDTFFASIPLILSKHPFTKFICPGMAGEAEIHKLIEKFDIEQAVELLPNQSSTGMANLFRRADIAISPSTHDGTPNTLLEAMASGCYPIAGDLDSIREWITPGENGSLIDPADPQALADSVSKAFKDPDLRLQASEINQKIIHERAEYRASMARVVEFYQTVLGK